MFPLCMYASPVRLKVTVSLQEWALMTYLEKRGIVSRVQPVFIGRETRTGAVGRLEPCGYAAGC